MESWDMFLFYFKIDFSAFKKILTRNNNGEKNIMKRKGKDGIQSTSRVAFNRKKGTSCQEG